MTISIDLGKRNGGTREFENPRKLAEWLRGEAGHWEWLEANGGSLTSSYRKLSEWGDKLVEPKLLDADMDFVVGEIGKVYRHNYLLCSDSKAAKLVKELKIGGDNVALGALYQYGNQVVNGSDQRKGAFSVMAYDAGFTKKSLRGLRQEYITDLKAEASVSYWRLRRLWCYIRATLFGLVCLGVLIGGWLACDEAIMDAWKASKLAIHHGAIVLIAASLYFWVARMFARLAISQVDLASMAAEKILMIQTYLAMVKDEKFQDNAQLNALLPHLFSHSRISASMAKSAELPPGSMDAAMKIANKIKA